jgi:hypothetical protein
MLDLRLGLTLLVCFIKQLGLIFVGLCLGETLVVLYLLLTVLRLLALLLELVLGSLQLGKVGPVVPYITVNHSLIIKLNAQ